MSRSSDRSVSPLSLSSARSSRVEDTEVERFLSTEEVVENIEDLEITSENLVALEDAIFAYGKSYKHDFLNIYTSTDFNPNLDVFLSRHASRKEASLRYCWEVLGWRPSKDTKKIIIKY